MNAEGANLHDHFQFLYRIPQHLLQDIQTSQPPPPVFCFDATDAILAAGPDIEDDRLDTVARQAVPGQVVQRLSTSNTIRLSRAPGLRTGDVWRSIIQSRLHTSSLRAGTAGPDGPGPG